MPRGASAKREREYKELKREFKKEGRYRGREEEVASRIVNKQRSRFGETKREKDKDRKGKSPDRDLPIKNYQHKTAPQVQRALSHLTKRQLAEIQHYEKQHKNRKTVLEAISETKHNGSNGHRLDSNHSRHRQHHLRGNGQVRRGNGHSAQDGDITTDHREIRRWVEKRGGHPATVRRTVGSRHKPGVLRIDFPGYSGGKTLEKISWDEFFEKFDEANLGFLHQDRTAGGKTSRFNKLVSR